MKPRQSLRSQTKNYISSRQPRPWILAVMLTGLIILNAYPNLIEIVLNNTTLFLKATLIPHHSTMIQAENKTPLVSQISEGQPSEGDQSVDHKSAHQQLPHLADLPYSAIGEMIPVEPKLIGFTLDLTQLQPQKKHTALPTQVIEAIRQDLLKNIGTIPQQLHIIQATPQHWPNTCLGLAQVGEFCGQQMVPGWRVVIAEDQQTWVYRTDATGKLLRLEANQRSASPPSLTVLSPN